MVQLDKIKKRRGMYIETCAFCGRTIQQVMQMVKSPINSNIYICDKCAEITVAVSNGEINKKSSSDLRKYWKNTRSMEILKKKSRFDNAVFDLTPSQIHRELDKYIIL